MSFFGQLRGIVWTGVCEDLGNLQGFFDSGFFQDGWELFFSKVTNRTPMLFGLTPKDNDSIEPLNKKWRDIWLNLSFFDPAGG